jgi:gamma-glutamyltranspeptidase/glutathione hydrolase
VDAARWCLAGREGTGFDTWDGAPGTSSEQLVRVEAGAPFADGLRQRGHRVDVAEPGAGFGHAHVVVRTDSGLAAATDGRALTGAAAVW